MNKKMAVLQFKCLDMNLILLRKLLCSYFEFSHNSVLICHILVVVVATFTSEQVETVEPVLKVVKLTLQFFWVYLVGERNRKQLKD